MGDNGFDWSLGAVLDKGLKERSGLGTAVSAGGNFLGGMAQYGAYRQQGVNARANAGNLRRQAEVDYSAAVGNELLQRRNQALATGQARASRAGSGFLDAGTANVDEVNVARGYEQAIGQAAAQRENQRRSVLYQADMSDWEAEQARRKAKGSLLSTGMSLLGTVAGAFAGPAGASLGSAAGRMAGQVTNNYLGR